MAPSLVSILAPKKLGGWHSWIVEACPAKQMSKTLGPILQLEVSCLSSSTRMSTIIKHRCRENKEKIHVEFMSISMVVPNIIKSYPMYRLEPVAVIWRHLASGLARPVQHGVLRETRRGTVWLRDHAGSTFPKTLIRETFSPRVQHGANSLPLQRWKTSLLYVYVNYWLSTWKAVKPFFSGHYGKKP